jgi:hypothetical protein
LFEINREIALALSRGIGETELKHMALASGMKTMIDDGLDKLGQITLTEIIRVVPIEAIKEFLSRGKETAADADDPAGKMPPSYRESVHIDLADPEKEADAIYRLFERYRAMRETFGQAKGPSDREHFRELIVRFFDKVVDKYGCERVHFAFTGQDEKIKITATPVKDDRQPNRLEIS